MARRRRGGSSRRGRGRGRRGALVVREASYQIPNQESCNFTEFSFRKNVYDGDPGTGVPSTANLQLSEILAGLYTALTGLAPTSSVGPFNVKKFRVTSMVCEPAQGLSGAGSFAGGPAQPYDISMGLSGQSYFQNDVQKPTRIRFREEYGKDGMWHVLVNAALQATDPGVASPYFAIFTNVVQNNQALLGTVEIRVRVAWKDIEG